MKQMYDSGGKYGGWDKMKWKLVKHKSTYHRMRRGYNINYIQSDWEKLVQEHIMNIINKLD